MSSKIVIDNSNNVLTYENSQLTLPVPDQAGAVPVAISNSSYGLDYELLGCFKNRIINGAMVFDQRNSGSSVSISSTRSFYLDRWSAQASGSGAVTIQQVSVDANAANAPDGFIYSMLFTVSTADTSLSGESYYFMHSVEGNYCSDFNWGTSDAASVNLSFWVKTSLAGSYGFTIYNKAETLSYATTYTISSSNTWTKVSINIPGPTTGTWESGDENSLYLKFFLSSDSTTSTLNSWDTNASNIGKIALGADSSSYNWMATLSNTFYITGVQLEIGSDASDFDHKLYPIEYDLCRRYYIKIKASSSGYTIFGHGCVIPATSPSTTSAFIILKYPLQMRITSTITKPTISLSNLCLYNDSTSLSAPGTGLSVDSASSHSSYDMMMVKVNASSGTLTAGDSVFLATNNNSTGYVEIDCEY
jgi:hypothetical protein